MIEPLVSICCTAYNHELYIADAIEGFLKQKVNFKYEILIHDDASTDGTTEIIKKYEKKHQDILFPIYQKENKYSQGIKIFMTYNWPRARGKYIALCEGDDYWTDSSKLQKEVDFLEKNSDYGMVHTDADQYYTRTRKIIRNFNKTKGKIISEEHVYENILRSNYPVFTCTVVLRKECLEYFENDYPKFKMGDTILWLEISQRKKIKYIFESTAIKQELEESATNSKDTEKLIEFKKSGYELYKYFIKKYGCSKESERIVHANSNKVLLGLSYKVKDKELAYKSFQNIIMLAGIKFLSIKDIVKFISVRFKAGANIRN